MVATNNTGHIFKVWIFLFKKFYYLTFLSVCGRMWWRDLENRQKSFTLNFPFEISGAKCVEQNGNLQSWCYFLKPILMPEEEGINTKYISSVCCVPPKSTAYVFPQKMKNPPAGLIFDLTRSRASIFSLTRVLDSTNWNLIHWPVVH